MGTSDDDFGARHCLEDERDRTFDAEGFGLVDEGDIGSGTMNVFALVRAQHWDAALLRWSACCAISASTGSRSSRSGT